MRAYKCDVCGKYCEDCYEIKDDTFDIFLSDFVDRGQYDKKKGGSTRFVFWMLCRY